MTVIDLAARRVRRERPSARQLRFGRPVSWWCHNLIALAAVVGCVSVLIVWIW